MTDIKLRPYQRDFIDAVRNEFIHNHRRVVGVAPCGAGKTIMTGWMIKESLNRNKRSIFFVHRHELIEQTSQTFTALDIPHGIISAGLPMNLNLPVQIASVQTLARRIEDERINIPSPDFLICDECHHILANTYKKVLNAFPDAFLLGVTATPQRMGGKTLCDVFDYMVQSLTVNQLIKQGNLTSFDYFAAPIPINLKSVRIHNGDFDSKDLESAMSNKKITGDIVQNYLNFAYGKSAICYCVNVNHSKTIANAFLDAEISAAHIDGDTPKILRAKLVEDFRQGKIQVLCNAELFGEGFDVPRCQAVILARPTKSLTLYIQQSMRSMRPDPDDPSKVAIIIDCVQNRERHGLPNDFRDWSLNPNNIKTVRCPACHKDIIPVTFTKKEHSPLNFVKEHGSFFLKDSYSKDGEPVKLTFLCIDLGNGQSGEPVSIAEDSDGIFMKICPECGYLFVPKAPPLKGMRQPKYRDGKLEKINVSFDDTKVADTKVADTVIRKPTKPDEFLILAKQKNYKIGWVAIQSLAFAQSYDDCLHIADICGYKPGWAWHKWQHIQQELAQKKSLQRVFAVC